MLILKSASEQLLLLLLFKDVDSARLRESSQLPISPNTPAPQYQPIDRSKRNGNISEDKKVSTLEQPIGQ